MDSTINMFELLNKEENFNQSIPYSYGKLIENLEECTRDLEHLNPMSFLTAVYEFTKAFHILSSALTLAFADITEKVETWKNLYQNYPECNDMQSLMLIEIEKGVHILNGENNSTKGFKKNSEYHKYVSGSRTLVRLTWFLNFMKMVLYNLKTTNDSFSSCLKKAYKEILSPHHTWMVRQAAKVAFGFISTEREKTFKIFFSKEDN